MLVGLVTGCAAGEGIDELDPGFQRPDAADPVAPDSGQGSDPTTTSDAASASSDASIPGPRADGGTDAAATPGDQDAAVDGSRDAGSDAVLPDATLPGADAAADAAPGDDAKADAGAFESVCMGGKVGTDSTKLNPGSAYGSVEFWLPPSNEITRLQTTLFVPEEPTTRGTLFLWPGLQPLRGKDPAGYGNGVLQPVLTWGSSCAPKKPASYTSWWISGMYVNVTTSAAGPTGCLGGDAMNVEVGDSLRMDMRLAGTKWTQTVRNEENGKSVDFTNDLKGQFQNRAIFDIEEVSSTKPSEDVIFVDSILSFASPASSCQPSQRGPRDYFSAPQLSADGLHCCYAKIVLRSRGVAATTPDQP